ncbi:MAG TPA: site-specific integrase [Mycobacteriales bacterium]
MAGKRRGAGEGTVFQIPNGRWRAELDLGMVDGRRRRKTAIRKTQREAQAWLAQAREAKNTGGLVSRTPSLGEWFECYLTEVAPNRVRASTLSNYRRDFERHIQPGLGGIRLDALGPEHLIRFYNRKTAEGMSAHHVRYLHAQIRRALKIAMKWGRVSRNVALVVEPPEVPDHEVKPLTVAEARRLLDAAKDDRLRARWVLGLSLGLRQSEVLGLWWEDIDLDAATLRVRRQLLRRRNPGDTLTFGPPKSARSRRVLSLPAPLVTVLRDHKSTQDTERANAATWADPRLVFASATGGPIDHRNDTRAFKALLVRAGVRCVEVRRPDGTTALVPNVRLHDLRHTAASLLLAQFVPARVVMEVLGHSQISITMNTYSHVMPAQLKNAADAMTAALWDVE